MVRLSLVNLYLHGFVAPQVHEYDTLTSEDRWNEYADVILANPPFMSPKGGIRPHNRFSVKSKRSEVLFVDYMAEHLTPNGRAGIIVPEGIVFKSENAYKQLRKMLVEEYLVAVVSLPAGVFNPYSGVKTSILILDKAQARRRDRIGFFKVENDGFDLGAQRRKIDENDLPQIEQAVMEYLNMDEQDKDSSESILNILTGHGSVQIVAKEKIATNGEYNLSGERYRDSRIRTKTKWPMVELQQICDSILSGGTPSTKNQEYWNGDIPWITSADIVNIKIAKPRKYITQDAIKESATNLIPRGNLIVVTRVGLGKLFRNDFDVCISQDSQGLILKDIVSADYLVYLLRNQVENFKNTSQGSTIQGVTKKQLAEIEVPLPPLEIQRDVVAEIDGYQKVIDGAQAVVENYRTHITIDPDWPKVELGKIFQLSSGRGLTQSQIKSGPFPVYGGNGVSGFHSDYFVDEPIIVIGRVGAYCGAVHITQPKAWVTDNGLYITNYKREVNQRYLAQILTQLNLNRFAKVGGQPSISQTTVYECKIPLPPLATQQAIVAEIEVEQSFITASRELIKHFEKKIQTAVTRVWGE